MKKLLCMLLIAALCCAVVPTLAEETDIGALGSVTVTPSAEKSFGIALEGDMPERSLLDDSIAKADIGKAADDVTRATTSDSVSISGNQFTVRTPYNVTFSYTAPSGVYVLTQDYNQQRDLFNQFYNDPQGVCNQFIERGMHINMYDAASRVDVYLYLYDTPVAAAFPNANSMSSADAEALVGYMFTDSGYFLNCTEAVFGWAGGNVWFVGDGRTVDGYVVLCTFVNGREIYSRVKVSSDSEYNTIIRLLENLTIS